MKKPVYIEDEMASVVNKTSAKLALKIPAIGQVYFMFGHPKEIVSRLQAMTNSPNFQTKKYPLVCLLTDVPIDMGNEGVYGIAKLQMVILTITKAEYIAPERLEKTFKPILHPIYGYFMEQLYEHSQFSKARQSYHD